MCFFFFFFQTSWDAVNWNVARCGSLHMSQLHCIKCDVYSVTTHPTQTLWGSKDCVAVGKLNPLIQHCCTQWIIANRIAVNSLLHDALRDDRADLCKLLIVQLNIQTNKQTGGIWVDLKICTSSIAWCTSSSVVCASEDGPRPWWRDGILNQNFRCFMCWQTK